MKNKVICKEKQGAMITVAKAISKETGIKQRSCKYFHGYKNLKYEYGWETEELYFYFLLHWLENVVSRVYFENKKCY